MINRPIPNGISYLCSGHIKRVKGAYIESLWVQYALDHLYEAKSENICRYCALNIKEFDQIGLINYEEIHNDCLKDFLILAKGELE